MKTRRAALFRRAIVDPLSVRHAHGDLGPLLAFANHPPPLAATWRARCGGWPGFARRVPKTPRRPQIVAHPRHLRKYDHSAPWPLNPFPGKVRERSREIGEFSASARFSHFVIPAMEFSLRCAPPFRPSAFPLARSTTAPHSAASAVAAYAFRGQRAEHALNRAGSPDKVRTGAWQHVTIHHHPKQGVRPESNLLRASCVWTDIT